jgi:hypothetical protein
MIITDVIRSASTAPEIQFLLTSYVEAARYCDPLGRLPAELRDLPIGGTADLAARIARLKTAFGVPFEELREQDRAIVREALDIYSCALIRLRYLTEAEREMLAHAA